SVTAEDAFGNTVAGYTGTVHLSSSDPQAQLPGDYTFTAADAGTHAFAVALQTAGRQSVSATDTASLTGTQSGIPVAAGPTVFDPNLGVRTVVSGLPSPTTIHFLGDHDFFVTEKATGKIDHVQNGVSAPTSFDFGAGPVPNLPVNFNSE